MLAACSRTTSGLSHTPTGPAGTGTSGASPTAAPATQAATQEKDYRGIDPDTRASLDDLQRAWEKGHEPWRASAPDVARAHLLSLGYADPNVRADLVNAHREDGTAVAEVVYSVGAAIAAPGGVHGIVEVGQLPGGKIFFVRASSSDGLALAAVERRAGSLTAHMTASGPGQVSGTVRVPGGAAGAARSAAPDGNGFAVLSFDDKDGSAPLILDLRQRQGDRAWIVEARVQPVPAPPGNGALGPGSVLRLDGVGPVKVGMPLEEARKAAGVPLTLIETPHCRSLQPDAVPPGVVLTSTSGGTVDFVNVSAESMATAKGIKAGSRVGEVWNAYPGQLTDHLRYEPGGQSGRIVLRSRDPGLQGLALVFEIAGDRVSSMLAGRGVEAEELCA